LTDEAVDLFDRCLADAYHRASRDLEDFRLSVASATNEKVRLFREISQLVLDPKVRDADLRRAIYDRIPQAELRAAVEDSDRIIRPLNDHYFDFLESRYTYLRQFTPEFIGALPSISIGVRYGLGLMWLGLIVAETISADSGIGYLAMNASEWLTTSGWDFRVTELGESRGRSSRCTSPTEPGTGPMRLPAAKNSGSHWPAPWRPIPGSSSWTSHWVRSMR
jgi:hypothetical protein